MPYEIIGRNTLQKGKTLWELVGNLRNSGVGRIVIRNQWSRYPEPSYYKIIKVEGMLPEGKVQCLPPVIDLGEVRRVRVEADHVFNGKYMGRINLGSVSYKPDYRLIPKEEEESFTKLKRGELPESLVKTNICPTHTSFPPVLRDLLIRRQRAQGGPIKEPILPLVYNPAARVAKAGEQPNVKVDPNVINPVSLSLYSDV